VEFVSLNSRRESFMSDALSETVQFEFLKEEVIRNVTSDLGRRHRSLWLTKRPQRMAGFSRWLKITWPCNLWVATSITTQRSTSRTKHLLRVGDENTTRFLSVEPQWEEVVLEKWLPRKNWVIQGGESGPNAHGFHVDWADSLIKQCKSSKVPFFLKQLGSNVCWKHEQASFEHSHGGNWDERPKRLRVRQFPACEPSSSKRDT